MMNVWRPLALAAALHVVAGVGVAAAQTVIVRSAPPGSTVEVVINAATIGTATVDANGDAIVTAAPSAVVSKTEVDAYVYVDACDTVRRVLIVERGQPPPAPGESCERREITGVFVVRPVSTLVVNVAAANPTVLLRQGAVSLRPPKVWAPAPTGLVLFGGAGFVKVRDAVAVACGSVEQCSGKDFRGAYTAGAAYWFTRYLAAEASYVKPAQVTADGTGENFRFNSFLDAELLTAAAKVGVPRGPVRIYGQIGVNYHQATISTTQTNEDVTTTVDGVTRTIEGGTQTFALRTRGWGWQLGGGVEVWVIPALAIYAEGGTATLKGTAVDEGDGAIADRLTFILFGARVRIGG